jgi:hypothetical protein
MTDMNRHLGLWAYLIITILVTLVYIPTLSGEFILDDRPLIEKNAYIKELHTPMSYLFQEDGITDEHDADGYHTGYYRPLIYLSYSIDYMLWGLHAPGFRITNLLLHLCCCFILFRFVRSLVNDSHAALWATLIFAVHPVNTEAISWIGSRDNILAALFSIACLSFYINGVEQGNRLSRMAAVLAFVLAILSKEMGLMVLPLLFLYQRLLPRTRRKLRDELLSYLPFLIVAFGYFVLRKAVTSSFSSPLQMVELWKSILFAPYLVLWNLKLIFLPFGLHNFVVEYPTDYVTWQALTGVLYACFLALLLWRVRKMKLVVFSILSFHVLIFPTLNIIPTSAISLVSMRWLYFPMAFLTIVFVQGLRRLLATNRFVTIGGLWAVLAYFGAYSYILNQTLWNSERNFFRQEVLNFGNDYYAGGFAETLQEQGKYQDAERYFQIAITKYPREAMNYLNYSALLIDTGRPDLALTYLDKAKGLSMTRNRRAQWFNNMGVAHFRLKNYPKSLSYFEQAAMLVPGNIEFLGNLGGAYTANGNCEKGISVLEKALALAPGAISLLRNLAFTYVQMERPQDAIKVLQRIPKERRSDSGVQEIFEKAQKGLLKAGGSTNNQRR